MEIPKGVWYEVKRDRWRVKLFCDGVLFHRSYHREYDEALLEWQQAKRKMKKPRLIVPLAEASLINRFLCRPLPGSSRIRGH